MNGPYENLIQSGLDNPACLDHAEYGPIEKRFVKRPDDAYRVKSLTAKFSVICAVILLVAAASTTGMSGWAYYSMRQRADNSPCTYTAFVLDTDAIPSCGLPAMHHPPCQINSTGALLTSEMFNNAVGPWKSGELDGVVDGGYSGSVCGFELERSRTHLVVRQPGLYQLTGQVTFTDDGPAHLEWQVNHAEWIAVKRGRGDRAGPTQARLEAVRRLAAGDKLSLHLDRGERRLATPAPTTHIGLVRL